MFQRLPQFAKQRQHGVYPVPRHRVVQRHGVHEVYEAILGVLEPFRQKTVAKQRFRLLSPLD